MTALFDVAAHSRRNGLLHALERAIPPAKLVETFNEMQDEFGEICVVSIREHEPEDEGQ